MLTETVRRSLAALRQPRCAARIARVLWLVWAVILWNVILDQTIVLAGRRYLIAAAAAAGTPGLHPRVVDWLRPAAEHGLLLATATAIVTMGAGLGLIAAAKDT